MEVEHIPGGCTGLVQPVDVGINKPFKSRLKEAWETWMIIEVGIHDLLTSPLREEVIDWVIKSFNALKVKNQLIRNAWRHGQFTYFPPTCAERPTNMETSDTAEL